MTPGSVLHDPEFHFHDGEIGNKLFVILNDDEVVKRPSVAFLLPGKRKARFSLSLQINDLRRKPLICAPVHGRDDDFLRSHQ